jgi:hypothetical protein
MVLDLTAQLDRESAERHKVETILRELMEEGTYAMPLTGSAEEQRREITAQELGALLSGIDSPGRIVDP